MRTVWFLLDCHSLSVFFSFSLAISTSTSRETTPESEDDEEEDFGDEDFEEEDDNFAEEESFVLGPNSPSEENPKSPKAPLSRTVSRNEEDLRETYGRCFREFYPNQVKKK